jgi:O-antigen/teichoic acid export membrane protein
MGRVQTYSDTVHRYFLQDSLRRNSSLLILSQAINAGAAFLFWIICARLFTTSQVGMAVAIVAFGLLVSTFTNLGLPNTVIRFLPTSKRPGGLFTCSLYLATSCSVVGALLSIVLIKFLVPKLGIVQSTEYLSLMLVLLIVGNSLSGILDSVLMSFRKGQYILWKALIISIPRLVLPIFVVSFGLRGIVSIYVVMLLVGISYNLYVILRKLLKDQPLAPVLDEILEHKSYTAANYFGIIFAILPATLLPIIVLDRLGATDAAYFYMPMQIAVFLNYIPSSTSQALISESSQSEDPSTYKSHFTNALLHSYRLLVPATLLLIALGWPILHLYGPDYAAAGYPVLILLSGSMVFVTINFLGDTWLNIQRRSMAYFLMNAFNAIAVVGLAFLLSDHGLTGIGFGWLAGQAISAVVYLAIFGRNSLLPAPFSRPKHTSRNLRRAGHTLPRTSRPPSISV